jgi:CRISPR-associated Csx2 family protein
MKVITFLGVAAYDRVTYVWNNRSYTTELFPEALGIWLQQDITEMLVLLTEAAKSSKNWDRLQARLTGKVVLNPQDIPSGRNEEELWQIFNKLTTSLSAGDEIVLDITRAFRSIPILALLAVNFLRTAQSLEMKHLLYGAFDARENATGRAPVFDLTPFLSLLEWVTATAQFIRTGNGQALAELLPDAPQPLQDLRASIRAIAEGLHLLRPLHVIEEAAQLSNRIAGASPTIGQTVPPLATLLGRVQDAYGSFGLTDPADYSHNARACLQQQLRMVEWYANKGQIVHVLSLARQWLPSLLCYRFGLDPMEPANREDMELLLRGGTDKDSGRESRYLSEWASVPSGKRLRALWGGGLNLANLRNDVLHAGFLRHPKNAGTIVALTQEVVGELRAIAAQWQL